MPTDRVRLVPLRVEEDWERCREAVQRLEAASDPSCFMTWAYQRGVWRLADERSTWLIEIRAGADRAEDMIGAAFWQESVDAHRLLPFRRLRSLDYNVMRMPPLLMRRGQEPLVCERLLGGLSEASRAAGADLVALYKLDELSMAPLVAQLRRQRTTFQLRPFNASPQVVLPERYEDYWNGKSRKSRYNIGRSERQLTEAVGVPLTLWRGRGDIAETPEFREQWARFEQLRGGSWQHAKAAGTASVSTSALDQLYREAVSDWSRRGWLDLTVLSAGDRPVAGQLGAVIGTQSWVVQMAFDMALQAFSPGRVLLRMWLEDSHRRGDRIIELGGESQGWKSFWSNAQVSTYQIQWPVRGAKAALWVVGQKLRRARAHEEPSDDRDRTAGDE